MTATVELVNLRFSYPDGQEVLRGVNLRIDQGESVGLIGPNGAGKTTLLLHLNGILQGKGETRLFGMAADKNSIKHIRSRIGIVFQDPDDQLFSATVFDDVAYGPLNMGLPNAVVQSRVTQALAEVGLAGFETRTPHHLSFGEKKRISLATVLSMTPELLVLDEPTSNLDPRQRKNLIALLKNIPVTKIIASHDLEMVRLLCDRVLVLSNGTITVDGKVEDILSNPEIMRQNGLEVLSS
jgi:cobalt/nickel transport system ATP-binding protein